MPRAWRTARPDTAPSHRRLSGRFPRAPRVADRTPGHGSLRGPPKPVPATPAAAPEAPAGDRASRRGRRIRRSRTIPPHFVHVFKLEFRDSPTVMDSRFRGNDVIFSEIRYFFADRHSRETLTLTVVSGKAGIGAARGAPARQSSSPPSEGCTGTTTGACSDPSAMCLRLHSRHTTTSNFRSRPGHGDVVGISPPSLPSERLIVVIRRTLSGLAEIAALPPPTAGVGDGRMTQANHPPGNPGRFT